MVPPIDVSDINSIDDAKKAIETGEISKEQAEFIAEALHVIKNNKEQPSIIFNLLEKYVKASVNETEYEQIKKTLSQGNNTIKKSDLDILVKLYIKGYQSSDLLRLKGLMIRFNINKIDENIQNDIDELRSLIVQDVRRIQTNLNQQLDNMITSGKIIVPTTFDDHQAKGIFIRDIEKLIPEIKDSWIGARDQRGAANIYTKLKQEYQSELGNIKIPSSFARGK